MDSSFSHSPSYSMDEEQLNIPTTHLSLSSFFTNKPSSKAIGERLNTSNSYFSPSSFYKTPTSGVKDKRQSASEVFSHGLSNIPMSSFNTSLFSCSIHSFDFDDKPFQPYGPPLPVIALEAILDLPCVKDVFLKLEPNGYASLVCGRQLYTWKYKDEGSLEPYPRCAELPLPPSDLAYSTDLVHCWGGALAASPEGHVRFWPNVNQDGVCADAQPDLQGQECCALVPLAQKTEEPFGCVLATTSGSLIVVTPVTGDGKLAVVCRILCLPTGVLAGIGRNVSTFIFSPPQHTETKQLTRILGSESEFYVLNSNNELKKWHIQAPHAQDKLLFELNLNKDLKKHFSNVMKKEDPTVLATLKAWCLDIQLSSHGILIFAAGTLKAHIGETVYFGFGVIDLEKPSDVFSDFYVTTYTELYREDFEERLLDYKFLLPNINSSFAYFYRVDKVVTLPIFSRGQHTMMDFSENLVLGAGHCDGLPLFFLKECGIVSYGHQDIFIESRLNVSNKEVDCEQTNPNDNFQLLLQALIAFCANKREESVRLIQDIDGPLDAPALAISKNIIDDCPATDARWCASLPKSFVSTPLLIPYQLEDKLKTHELLLAFLKDMHITQQLKEETHALLREHAEKISAAIVLENCRLDHGDVLETVISDTAKQREGMKGQFSLIDVFFRELSAFHELFHGLITWEVLKLEEGDKDDRLHALLTVNKIIIGLLNAIWLKRDNHPELSAPNSICWTAVEEGSGIQLYVHQQLELNLIYGFQLCDDSVEMQNVLLQQYVELLDKYLASTSGMSTHFLEPLVSFGHCECAAALAEKYMDFEILMQICAGTNDSLRLQKYMDQFAQQNFTQFVLKWYWNKGHYNRLFSLKLQDRSLLGSFLQHHQELCWMYYMQEQMYEAASATLYRLALKEKDFVARKRTLLSLSKACVLISDMSPDLKDRQMQAINDELDLIYYQDEVPKCVAEAFGVDTSDLKKVQVLTPQEMIQMFISDENVTASHLDFKMALELLRYIKKDVDDPEIITLRKNIWTKAVLRDNWDEMDVTNPIESFKETVFFQIINLAHSRGLNMADFLIPVDVLLEYWELQNLGERAQFLLRAGYEEILKQIQ